MYSLDYFCELLGEDRRPTGRGKHTTFVGSLHLAKSSSATPPPQKLKRFYFLQQPTYQLPHADIPAERDRGGPYPRDRHLFVRQESRLKADGSQASGQHQRNSGHQVHWYPGGDRAAFVA